MLFFLQRIPCQPLELWVNENWIWVVALDLRFSWQWGDLYCWYTVILWSIIQDFLFCSCWGYVLLSILCFGANWVWAFFVSLQLYYLFPLLFLLKCFSLQSFFCFVFVVGFCQTACLRIQGRPKRDECVYNMTRFNSLIQDRKQAQDTDMRVYKSWTSHGNRYQNYCLLGYDAM